MKDDDIIIRIVDLPICVYGVTIPHDDGTYNVYINAKYDIETRQKALRHELRHVINYDFDNFDSIKIIEDRAKTG